MSWSHCLFSFNRATFKLPAGAGWLALLLGLGLNALGQEAAPSLKFVDYPLLAQSSPRTATNVVDHIVLHFCSGIKIHPDDPFNINYQADIFRKASASANYLIGRDGTVYRLVPETRAAWHAGTGHLSWDPTLKSMNQRAIGIEMFAIGSTNDMSVFGFTQAQYDDVKTKHPDWIGFSDAQYVALKQLIEQIRSRQPAILFDRFHIIGHEEWAGRARRTDPGELFDWTRIGLTRERPSTAQ